MGQSQTSRCALFSPTTPPITIAKLAGPLPARRGPQLLGALANAENTHRFRVGVRLLFHYLIFNVSAEFIAKHVSAIFPERLAARRAYQIHDDKLPTQPQR